MQNDRETTNRFIEALKQAEQSKDVNPLGQMFSEEASLSRIGQHGSRLGQEGARVFWQEYLAAFDQVRSEFTKVLQGEGFTALEWRSERTAQNGTRIAYAGVSLIETTDGKVIAFRTYYDTSPFGSNTAQHNAESTRP